MIDSTTNRLLMSDSLKGMIPELEDEITQNLTSMDSVVITVIEINGLEPIIGTLDGIQIEKQSIKLDVKLKLEEAYDMFTLIASGGDCDLLCNGIQLHLSEKINRIIGPYILTSPKLFGIDISNKLCVLGMDLLKK